MSKHRNMTPDQIKNWRNVLTVHLGPYALIMPERQIYAYRDKIEAELAEASKPAKPKPIIHEKTGNCQHGVAPKWCNVCG